MATFHAIVFTSTGEEQVLKLRGSALDIVRHYLHEKGYTIKSLAQEKKRSWWEMIRGVELGPRIKPRNRIRLVKTIGKMMNRGYILERVIDFLLADEQENDVIAVLQKLRERAGKGYRDYTELFQAAQEYFDEEFFSLLVAGQKTGTVGQNLVDYAEGQEKILQQKGLLFRMISGKVLVFGIALVAFVVIVTVVVPQFTKLFAEKLELPFGMKIMMVTSQILRDDALALLLGLVFFLVVLMMAYYWHRGFRFSFQHVVLKIPVMGSLLRLMHTRNVLYLLGNMISKGVPLMQSLRIVIQQTSNLCFRSVYEAIEKSLEKGRKLDQIFKPIDGGIPQGYLLESVAQAMSLGAKGGNLGEMLTEAFETYDLLLHSRITLAIRVLGALLSLFTYAIIIFMIGSLALTMFSIIQNPLALS